MQRRAFLMRAGAGVAATAIAGPTIAQTGAPVRWRLATSWICKTAGACCCIVPIWSRLWASRC